MIGVFYRTEPVGNNYNSFPLEYYFQVIHDLPFVDGMGIVEAPNGFASVRFGQWFLSRT